MVNSPRNALRNRTVWMAVAAGLAVVLAVPTMAHAELKRITIGTNAAGTLYNQIGTVVSTLIQKETGIPTNVRPFAGTSVYLPQLHRGDIEFGLNSALDSSIAYHGQDEYKQPLTKLRGVMLVARAYYGFYAKNSSGLKSVGDLKGKPTVMSYRAIASFDRVNDAVIATAGLTVKDVKSVVVSGIPDTVRAIVDDRVVAGATIIGIPALREADAAVSGGLRVLALGPNENSDQRAGWFQGGHDQAVTRLCRCQPADESASFRCFPQHRRSFVGRRRLQSGQGDLSKLGVIAKGCSGVA